MKKAIVILVLLVSFFFVTILYQRHAKRVRHLRLQQQAADRVWNEFLKQYQKDIPIGTARFEVKKYLDERKALYLDGDKIMVKMGETPDPGPVCDDWYVYASFEFSQGDVVRSPQDRLTAISLRRVGHCL